MGLGVVRTIQGSEIRLAWHSRSASNFKGLFPCITIFIGEHHAPDRLARLSHDPSSPHETNKKISGTPQLQLSLLRHQCLLSRIKVEVTEPLDGAERLFAILDGIGDGFYAVDRLWRLTFFNRAAEAFLRLKRCDVLGRSLWEVFPQLDGTEMATSYRQVMQSRNDEIFETRSTVRPDRWVEIRVFATPEGLGMFSRDISDRKSAEEALRRSEEKLRAALDAGRLGAWERNLRTGDFRTTERYKANLGLPADAELTFEHLQQMRHPEDAGRVNAAIRRAIEEGEEYEVEYRVVWADGSVHWLLERGRTLYDENGRPKRMVGVILDMTSSRQAETSLRASELFKSAMLAASLDGIITINQDSRIIEWNSAAEAIFGYSRDLALGRDMTDLIVPLELRRAHRAGMEHYLSSGEGPVLGRRIEVEAMRSDGALFPMELAISPIDTPGDRHFTAFVRDITEGKQHEQYLRESEQRLKATYEHAFAGIGEVDLEGRFTRVNEQFCLLTGYSRDELLARTLFAITHPDDRAEDERLFRQQISGGIDAYRVDKRYIHKSGKVVWIKLSASAVRDASGTMLYGVRVVDDISEQKRADRHQKLLVNELNHRVKNSLATVQSIASQTLRNAESLDAARRAIDSRLQAMARAHDVLTRENWESAELWEVIAEAVAPYRNAQENRLHLMGPKVRVSPRMALTLSMAVQELATNAAKYGALSNEQGRISISWKVAASVPPSRLRLQWQESGGPSVATPSRRGFGSRLIERGLAQELDGEVKIEFAPEGVICTVDAPLT